MHIIILLREFIFLLRPAYTLYIRLFPQPAGKALPCCFPHILNRLGHSSWVLAWSRCLNLEGAGLKWRRDVLRGQLWSWSLRGSWAKRAKACAKLARIWAETFSFLAGLSFFMFFQSNCRSKHQGGLEHRNCMRQPMLQIQISIIIEGTTWHTPTTISLVQNLGPALRKTCAMQVLSYPTVLHKSAN